MRIILCLFVFTIGNILLGQSDVFSSLHNQYNNYKDERLVDRRFKHYDIVPIIKSLKSPFIVKTEGQSVEGRDIFSIRIGRGSETVLLWSQMHGDEPTATAALFDIIRFLQVENDGFDAFREKILDNLTLVFIPMLNPDGAEHFKRRNALGIDLNRDALRLSSPEAQILKQVRDELDADWGFNLHDQSRFYGAGYPTENMATLSFLAPAYNFAKSVNNTREQSMQVIAELSKHLQGFIPNKVAKYSDAFEPRAFGDNIQKWGTRTILIESGGFPNDREKQYIRQLNFTSILYAFHSFVSQSYKNYTRSDYNAIPYNRGRVYNDLILREVMCNYGYYHALVDIAFDLHENNYNHVRQFFFKASIDDVGDLSYHRAYTELAPNDYTASFGTPYHKYLNDIQEFQTLDVNDLLSKGIAVVRVKNLTIPPWEKYQYPLVVLDEKESYDIRVRPGANPPLIIRNKEGKVVYGVINGQLIPVH